MGWGGARPAEDRLVPRPGWLRGGSGDAQLHLKDGTTLPAARDRLRTLKAKLE